MSRPCASTGPLLRLALAHRKDVTARVTGASMRPLLRQDSLVRLRRLRGSEPEVGDIVALELGSQVVLHRVVERRPHHLRTAGDACVTMDRPTPPAAVLAVARQIQGPGGIWFPAPHGAMLGVLLRLTGRLRRVIRAMPARSASYVVAMTAGWARGARFADRSG